MRLLMSSSSSEERKFKPKITEFSYLLQRKSLRQMRRYFKQKFEQWRAFTNYKKEIRSLNPPALDEAISIFIFDEFPYLTKYKEFAEFIQLAESLKIIILWDRYNKNEPITEGLDFTIIRSVLNKFNTRNLLNFFSEKANSLLFVHYYEKNREEDAYGQSDVEPEKLLEEMQALYEEANKYLQLQLDKFRHYFGEVTFHQPEFNFAEEDLSHFIF